MSTKRRDKRNRILRTGESQRKDGLYMYKYKDLNGKDAWVYSWKLEPTDKMPNGKRKDISLREKEKIIKQNLHDGIVPKGGNMTVLQLVEKYLLLKRGVKHNTEANYKTIVNYLKTDAFSQTRIDNVKTSDAQEWLIKLQDKNGKSYSSIHSIRGVLRPAFQMAVNDDYIRKNPFDFPLSTVLYNDSVKRDAISKADEKRFLTFIKNDDYYCKYFEGIYILFKTGLRISEFVGLTLKDINLKEKKININHQLQKKRDGTLVIESTKTNAGTRIIPITDDVCECFERIIKKRNAPKIEPNVDGYTGFLYFDRNGNPLVAMHWEKYFKHICNKYNSLYKVPLPKITPHVCRHTYCSNMAIAKVNPKILQDLMGHSDIGVTFNTYAHTKFEDMQEEVNKTCKSNITEFKKVVNS